MVRISESLVRKRAEHNELEISTLEELSLHQQDIEKIEYLDKWCRDLRILYLQSNLIEKIENVTRLKKLEYLNLALNNIERVENLEGCESLQKLDLTINFVAELTSITCLKDLEFMRELYLVGNPCTDYEGYRDYVIATLPRLEKLDGIEIEKSERIKAVQNYTRLRESIERQQKECIAKKKKENEEEERKAEQKNQSGFDRRWYTDMNQDKCVEDQPEDEEKEWDKKSKEFWDEKVPYTPQTRKQVHEHMKKARDRGEKKDKLEEAVKQRRLFGDDGRPLNVNEAKVDFSLTDDEENNQYVLDIAVFKHMDTSLMDADVNPTYVKVILKGKIFQLGLDEEVKPDVSVAQRSLTTGHLVIKMPKAKEILVSKSQKTEKPVNGPVLQEKAPKREILEVDPSKQTSVDFGNIVKEKQTIAPLGSSLRNANKIERANSPDFIDDPDVPPLI